MAFVLCLFVLFISSCPAICVCVGTESYLGCFQDRCSEGDCEGGTDFALTFTWKIDHSLTVDKCISYCLSFVSSTADIQYAGVENGNDCYCGRRGSDYDQHGQRSDCNTPCSGDSTQMCGGEYAIAVYDLYRTHCRVPSFPFGAPSQYLVEVGYSVTFTCNTGYYLDGTSSLQCISSGSPDWNREVPVCRQVICSPSCLYGGQCVALNRCSCNRQYTGDLCETPVCSTPCMNGGTCDAPNVCRCTYRYTGALCEIPLTEIPTTFKHTTVSHLKQTTVAPTIFKHTTKDGIHDQVFSNNPQSQCACTTQNQTGLVTGLAVGMVIFIMLFVIDLSIHINYRRKIKSKSTSGSKVTGKIEDTLRSDDVPEYQNAPDPKRQPGRENIQINMFDKSQPCDTYQSLDPKTMSGTKSEYQSLNNKAQNDNQPMDAYQSLDASTMSTSENEYKSLNNNGQKDIPLYEVPENPLGQENRVYENSVLS